MPTGPLYPLTFHPIFKERVWGGRRLHELYDKNLPPHVPIGESWEISDRPGDVSVIANGPLAGKDLHWVVQNFRSELMGRAVLSKLRFPLLVKILDAHQTLSLQVHPPATKAAQLLGEPKTEMWFIAEAAPRAELFVGLKRGCNSEDFAARIQSGKVADCFHRVHVRAGDAMFLPSGRVHALGAGLVIFEIQENSDTTYRVFDWDRKGLDGKARELHVKESLESIDFDDFEPGLLQPQLQKERPQVASLVHDRLFAVQIAIFKQGDTLPLVAGSMQIIGVVHGDLIVQSSQGELSLSAGRFCLVPASLTEVSLRGRKSATCLCVQAGQSAAS
jgi:mannose-6-phosphate isomerase